MVIINLTNLKYLLAVPIGYNMFILLHTTRSVILLDYSSSIIGNYFVLTGEETIPFACT